MTPPTNTTTMKERPILFKGEMIRAILDGRKTQTRRVVSAKMFPCVDWRYSRVGDRCHSLAAHAYGVPGDRLWVRETWAVQHEYDAAAPSEIGASARCHFAATENLGGLRKRPSIFMPRRLSRITLEITAVRVERLQNITRGDCMAEGCPFPNMADGPNPQEWYRALWEEINGAESWAANPWVWVIKFRRHPNP